MRRDVICGSRGESLMNLERRLSVFDGIAGGK
jgi:hypothetical protein